ncbi:MAG: HAD domain-containing protein [Pseudanabaena sp.]
MWIFLDIDGVLVPEKKFDRPVSKEDYMKFDPECLEKFENVLRRFTEAKVVISSSWREIFPFEVIPPLFSTDITSRIVGATPFLETRIIHDFQFLRHQEVLEYLRQNQSKGSSWVAVDDIPEHYAPNAPVVATDPYMGFDDNSAKKRTQYLTAFRI